VRGNPASAAPDQPPLVFDSEARRSIFYLKTDIALPDRRLRELHTEAAAAIVSRLPVVERLAQGLGWPGKVTPLSVGSYHLVHRLDRCEGGPLVVRSVLDGLFAQDRSLLLERSVAEWLGDANQVVPATHAVNFRADGAPFDYAVLSLASGLPLRDLGDQALDEQLGILSEIGASLRQIHEVPASGAGLLDFDRLNGGPVGVLERWSDYITLRLEDHVVACIAAGYVDERMAERILEMFKAMNPALQERPIRLLHGDPGAHNICVDPSSLEITAYLDWEDAIAGDPLFDVAMFSSFQPHRRMPAFMAGYGLDDPLPVTEARLVALYFLRIALSKTVHRLRFGVKDKPDRAPGHHRIYRGIDELERFF
jgi:aminoglycoside phosphotransferase (APT) family kinase protein